jgi:hypothetical protein
MVQIRQTKNDPAAKGFLFFWRVRAASTPPTCLQGYVLLVPARQARILGECIGDLSLTDIQSIVTSELSVNRQEPRTREALPKADL